MATITIPYGDKGYNVSITVTDHAGAAQSLTGYVATLKAWNAASPETLVINATCTNSLVTTGLCTYATTGTEPLGKYVGEVELTATGVVRSTQTCTVVVSESG